MDRSEAWPPFLERLRLALAAVAQADLSLVELYESHTDALAILSTLGTAPQGPPAGAWGM